MTSPMTSGSAKSSKLCGILQYSVFRVPVDAGADLVRCRAELSKIIHHEDDQVLFVNLGTAEERGDRVISAFGKLYTAIDAPGLVV